MLGSHPDAPHIPMRGPKPLKHPGGLLTLPLPVQMLIAMEIRTGLQLSILVHAEEFNFKELHCAHARGEQCACSDGV